MNWCRILTTVCKVILGYAHVVLLLAHTYRAYLESYRMKINALVHQFIDLCTILSWMYVYWTGALALLRLRNEYQINRNVDRRHAVAVEALWVFALMMTSTWITAVIIGCTFQPNCLLYSVIIFTVGMLVGNFDQELPQNGG